MTPKPQHTVIAREAGDRELCGGSIVISGMSGLYPQSRNVKEFADVLYNKINPVTVEGSRFNYAHPEVIHHTGTVPDLQNFDAQFFKVHYRLAMVMDAMARKILEQSYQAIYDAGVNPEDLSGKKVGVYIGSCFSETEKACFYDAASRSGFGIAGCSKTMFANRVSYWLNAKGPSMSIDEACCSSTAALEQAYLALSRGECEAAIVGGTYLCLHPQSSVHYGRITKLSLDGITKSFDQHAEGCGKSEGINVLFLQRASTALRIYAEVLHTKTEFVGMIKEETGPKYGFYRELSCSKNFIKNFYEEANVPPKAVEYVEAFGCAEPEADKVELESLEEVFCQDKEEPLLVGSVMSNIGYSEAASGIAAITKVLLGYHTGQLAANLHCAQPRQDIRALCDGRMRILTEHERFGRTYVGVNGLSVTGLNSHTLLHGHYKPKDPNRYVANIPYLVTVSGRHEAAVKYILDELKSHPIDAEQIALLHNINKINSSGHLGRGYTILQTDETGNTKALCEKAEFFDDARRPLWFVYSGMGSQWAGMGAQLMRLPIFAAAIERCRKVLDPKGIDIVHIITAPDGKIFDNILQSFVGIAAVQIGLTDILHEIGLVPDGIIGHSVGELGCAYADGCLTAEEMILAAYSRGLVSLETELIRGSMAAIGLGYQEIKDMCPPEIDVACHNGPDSSTISGPADVMREFVAELTAKGIFAKEVPCSNIAYHSRYIAEAGPKLLKYLKEVIKTPRLRTDRWISSSVPQEKWNEPSAQFNSAEYHTNNLLNAVLFEETSKLVPNNAVLVEVAPHGLLQAILKRSMSENCRNIPLTRRKHADNALFMLEAIGKLYMEGFNPKIEVLYPKINFPVSTGTPFLSNFIKWAHDEIWPYPTYSTAYRKTAASCNYVISIHDPESAYLRGHSMRGNTVFPYAATLNLVWDTFAMSTGAPKKQLNVEFTDLHLYAQPVVQEKRQLKIGVSLHRGTGKFEVLNNSAKVISGYIRATIKEDKQMSKQHFGEAMDDGDIFKLKSEDIYDMFLDRDYTYSGEFHSIMGANESLSSCELEWRNNWVTLIDGMLQLNMLRQPHSAVSLPTGIRRIYLNVDLHNEKLAVSSSQNRLQADVLELHDCTRCGGVLIENILFEHLPSKNYYDKILLTPSGTTTEPKTNGEVQELEALENCKITKSNVKLECAAFGDYNSLKWVQSSESEDKGPQVTVHYVGINHNDIKKMNCTQYHKINENAYGLDYSGVTDSGVRVMGIVPTGAARSVVNALPELTWPVPAHWTLEDAATVPFAYSLAFYCLYIKCDLLPKMAVYVHGASGAVGQAALSIALAAGCKVYASVGDSKKKAFLRRLFPQLKAENIGCSRDPNFQDFILNATKGFGCEIVISTARGSDMKNNIIKCCAYLGAIMDLTQIHDKETFLYGMHNLTKERSYRTIDWFGLFNGNTEEMKRIQVVMSDGIARGYVRPLSRVTFAAADAARAFRLVATNCNRGRVLLRLDDAMVPAQPRIKFSSTASHLVLCDGKTFSLQFVDRLVERGVRKLCLHITKPSILYLKYKIKSWESKGVQVTVSLDILKGDKDISALFNNAKTLGEVEGVYFVTNGDTYDEGLLNKLDAELRKSCFHIRHFAVISCDSKNEAVGEKIVTNRIKSRLPAVSLNLPRLNNYQQSLRSAALDAVERALRGAGSAMQGRVHDAPAPRLLQLLSHLAGMHLSEEMNKYITLKELGLHDDRIPIVHSFLRTEYNIVLDEEQIPSLTIEELLNYEKEVTNFPYEDLKGVASFFNYVDSDELSATTDILCLPTLINSSSMRDDEFNVGESFLCIVPGMEGHHERFRTLCARLKLPALVIQPGLDHLNESPRDTAERFTQVLLKRTGLNKSFYLLGYESGVIVALEMAAMLEAQGLTGTVFCVGCSPDELQRTLEQFCSEFGSEAQLQDAVVRHMYGLMAGGGSAAELESGLRRAASWQQKVDVCVRVLLGRVSHSAQYARALIESALARIHQVRQYKGTPHRLRSKLVFLRARSDTAQQHSLQQHSARPLQEHALAAPLAHAHRDLQCAALINANLHHQILQDFDNKNLCDTYLLNADSFMSRSDEIPTSA